MKTYLKAAVLQRVDTTRSIFIIDFKDYFQFWRDWWHVKPPLEGVWHILASDLNAQNVADNVVKVKGSGRRWARLMWQIQHLILPPGEPSSCGVPHLWSVRKKVAYFSAFPARLQLLWTLLSTISCRLQTLPPSLSLSCSQSEPVFSSSTHLLYHLSPSLVCVLLSFTLPVYADPLLITVSMTAALLILYSSRYQKI